MTLSDYNRDHYVNDDTRTTAELPAVTDAPPATAPISFWLSPFTRLPEVFATLQRRCGCAEPRDVRIVRNDAGWTVRAVIS